MALSVKAGSFDTPTVTGNQAIAGVGFQPKVVIFYLDTSALVKLYVDEDRSSMVREWVDDAEAVKKNSDQMIRQQRGREDLKSIIDFRQLNRSLHPGPVGVANVEITCSTCAAVRVSFLFEIADPIRVPCCILPRNGGAPVGRAVIYEQQLPGGIRLCADAGDCFLNKPLRFRNGIITETRTGSVRDFAVCINP